MKKDDLFLAGLAIVFCLISCKKDKKEDDHKSFDRIGMLTLLADNIIAPTHLSLLSNTEELKRLADEFAIVSNEENLSRLQVQWNATVSIWKRSEVFSFGKVKDSFLSNKIDSWPTHKNIIDTVVFGDNVITDSLFKQLTIVSKGLPAIEYLVFNKSGKNTAILDSFTNSVFAEKRKAYLGYLTQDLLTSVTNLQNIWAPEGQNYLLEFSQTDGTDVTSSLSLLVNAIIRELENTLHKRLVIPLGNENNGIPQPEKVEAPLSKNSLANIHQITIGLKEIVAGNTKENKGIDGLKSHLDACKAMYGDQLLSEKLLAQISSIENNLLLITIPLYLAVTEQKLAVDALKEAVRDLLVLFKADVASQLSVTIVPSDNDGD